MLCGAAALVSSEVAPLQADVKRLDGKKKQKDKKANRKKVTRSDW